MAYVVTKSKTRKPSKDEVTTEITRLQEYIKENVGGAVVDEDIKNTRISV